MIHRPRFTREQRRQIEEAIADVHYQRLTPEQGHQVMERIRNGERPYDLANLDPIELDVHRKPHAISRPQGGSE